MYVCVYMLCCARGGEKTHKSSSNSSSADETCGFINNPIPPDTAQQRGTVPPGS